MRDAEVVKLRAVARDCLGKHLYSSAIFFAGKLVTVAGNATQDVYMQASNVMSIPFTLYSPSIPSRFHLALLMNPKPKTQNP
jgi:hypothetical protein